MIFTATAIAGVWLVDLERHEDERGSFARSFCATTFAAHGLPEKFVQCSISSNRRKGTLRGLHWQAAPQAEGKLVRCTLGSLFDVAVDLRPDSPTKNRWTATKLSQANGRSLYIPPGCAHGFQTLSDNTEVFYQMTAPYSPELARAVRWNDPRFGIAWPLPDPILSENDATA